MRRLILAAAVCVATVAFGGERLIGRLLSVDGGTVSNRTTGWGAYTGGGTFVIAPPSKISIQCDQAAYICTDASGCDAGTGAKVATDQLLPTSVDTSRNLSGAAYNSDGGTTGVTVTYSGGWVSCSPDIGGQVCACKVFSRSGNE